MQPVSVVVVAANVAMRHTATLPHNNLSTAPQPRLSWPLSRPPTYFSPPHLVLLNTASSVGVDDPEIELCLCVPGGRGLGE